MHTPVTRISNFRMVREESVYVECCLGFEFRPSEARIAELLECRNQGFQFDLKSLVYLFLDVLHRLVKASAMTRSPSFAAGDMAVVKSLSRIFARTSVSLDVVSSRPRWAFTKPVVKECAWHPATSACGCLHRLDPEPRPWRRRERKLPRRARKNWCPLQC